MPGVECVRQLKALLPALPLIMLGSRPDPDLVFSAFLAGASLYLI
jgi:DNA-binding NarL/FixJ family response regulator